MLFIFNQRVVVATKRQQQQGFVCAKAKRQQQQGFVCAKAKRQQQQQLRQGEIDLWKVR